MNKLGCTNRIKDTLKELKTSCGKKQGTEYSIGFDVPEHSFYELVSKQYK